MPNPLADPATNIDITWTAIPAGRVTRNGLLQVAIVPTFKPHDASAGGTPCDISCLAAWPQVVEDLRSKLQLSFANITAKVTFPADSAHSPAWKKDFWVKIFGNRTAAAKIMAMPALKTRHVPFDVKVRSMQTTPTALISQGIHALYDMAVTPYNGSKNLAERYLVRHKISYQLDPLKWPDHDAYGDELNCPFDVPTLSDIVQKNKDVTKASKVAGDEIRLREERNRHRVFPLLRPAVAHGKKTDLLKYISDRIAAGAASQIHQFKDSPPKSLVGPGGSQSPDDYKLNWDAFLQHAIFWMRVPGFGALRRPSAPQNAIKGTPTPAYKFDPTHEPDILERLSFVKAYPALTPLLDLVINVTVDPAGLPLSGTLQVAWDISVDSALKGSTPATAYKIDEHSFAVPFDDDTLYLGGYVKLAACGLDQTGRPYTFTTLDVDGAALKLIQTAENFCRHEGGRIFVELNKAGIVNQPWSNYIARANGISYSQYSQQLLDAETANRAWASKPLGLSKSLNGGAIMHAVRYAGELVATELRVNSAPRPYTPQDLVLPSLRSDGFSLVAPDRHTALKKKIEDFIDAKSKGVAPDFYGEQLLYGYRPEVSYRTTEKEGWSSWQSLSLRLESFSRSGQVVYADTTWRAAILRLVAQQTLDGTPSQPADPSPDLHVSPRIFRWNGFSLGVKETDTVLRDSSAEALNPPPGSPNTPVKPVVFDSPVQPWQLTSEFTRPDDDVPLRYGYYYKFRVGLVDIAGNDMVAGNVSFSDADCASAEMRYLRYEPVLPPQVLLNQHPKDDPEIKRGLYQMVITRNYDEDIRWLVPPAVEERLVKRHGQSTASPGFTGVRLRQDGDFPRVAPDDKNADPLSPNLSLKKEELLPFHMPPNGSRPDKPYFPDPFAQGIAWRLEVPGTTIIIEGGVEEEASYYDGTSWPNAKPWRLVLKSTDETPRVVCRQGKRTLIVALPEGVIARFHLSSYLPKGGQSVMALVANIKADSPIQLAAAAGFNPYTTPVRELILINAGKTPRYSPVVDSIETSSPPYVLSRDENSLGATFNIGITLDALSSGKAAVRAAWTEPFDDGATPRGRHAGSATVVEEVLPLDLGAENTPLHYIKVNHKLPAPGYRLIEYSAVATTRYIDQFPGANPEDLEKKGPPCRIMVLNCARPLPIQFRYTVPTYLWSRETENVTRYSQTRSGGMRFFLDRPWNLTGDDELIGVVLPGGADSNLLWTSGWGSDPVRNSLIDRGLIPVRDSFQEFCTFLPGEILDPVEFARKLLSGKAADWTRKLERDTLDLLRDFLRDGGDEAKFRCDLAYDVDQLLVDWARENAADNKTNIVKEAGRLRAKLSDDFQTFLAPPSLFEINAGWKKVKIAEYPNETFEIIPYLPRHEENRDLMYFDLTAPKLPVEYTFFRLALVRYQPHSIDNDLNHLAVSKPILVDFAQIAPDRTVYVSRDSRDPDFLVVQVNPAKDVPSVATIRASLWHFFPAAHETEAEGWKRIYKITADTTPTGSLFYGRIPRELVNQPTKLVIFELPPEMNPADDDDDDPDMILPPGTPYLDILNI